MALTTATETRPTGEKQSVTGHTWAVTGRSEKSGDPQGLKVGQSELQESLPLHNGNADTWRPPRKKPNTEKKNVSHECIKLGKGLDGGDLIEPRAVANFEECQDLCNCIEGATRFSFLTMGTNCYCHTEDATESENSEAISGPTSCSTLPEDQDEPSKLLLRHPEAEIEVVDPGPWVYVYNISDKFRNDGQDDVCWTENCVFGGPPVQVHGVDIWSSHQYHMPRQIYYRFMKSPRRTFDVNKAEVFLVPAYVFIPGPKSRCARPSALMEALFEEPIIKTNCGLNSIRYVKNIYALQILYLFIDGHGRQPMSDKTTCVHSYQTSCPRACQLRLLFSAFPPLVPGPS